MLSYVIVIISAIVFTFIPAFLFVFFIMIDKDEEEFYRERDEEPPAKFFRGGETNSSKYDFWEYVFLGIPFGVSILIAHFLGINTKSVKILVGCVIIIFFIIFRILLEKLYYKIKYKRNPDAKDDEESNNE